MPRLGLEDWGNASGDCKASGKGEEVCPVPRKGLYQRVGVMESDRAAQARMREKLAAIPHWEDQRTAPAVRSG